MCFRPLSGRLLLLLAQLEQQFAVILRVLVAQDCHPHACALDEVGGGHLAVQVLDDEGGVVVRQPLRLVPLALFRPVRFGVGEGCRIWASGGGIRACVML